MCSTPRSGSTLLCETLLATGRLGRPLEHFEVFRHTGLPRQPREYFDPGSPAEVLQHLAPLEPGRPSTESSADWWSRIHAAGLTDNGVWGGKLMWGHVEDLLARARELDGLADADLNQVLTALLGDVTFVHVSRTDHVAQAVSLWRAVQTQTWRAQATRSQDGARYEFAGIDHLAAQLRAHDLQWRQWLTGHGHRAPAHGMVGQGHRHTARGRPEVAVEVVRNVVDVVVGQRDGRSAEWADRYRQDLARAA